MARKYEMPVSSAEVADKEDGMTDGDGSCSDNEVAGGEYSMTLLDWNDNWSPDPSILHFKGLGQPPEHSSLVSLPYLSSAPRLLDLLSSSAPQNLSSLALPSTASCSVLFRPIHVLRTIIRMI